MSLASNALRMAARSSIGRSWVVVRPVGGTISTPPTLTNVGTVAAFVMRNRIDAAAMALPQTTVYTAPWLAVGLTDLGLAADDVLVNSTLAKAFLVVGEPATDSGVLIAPLAPAAIPDGLDLLPEAALLENGDYILLEAD